MRKHTVQLLLAAFLGVASSVAIAAADTNYEPYFQTINRCIGGYLVQSGMRCAYAFEACEGQRGAAPETRNVHMVISCRINADGTCPAAYECARDHSFTQVGGVYDQHPRACSRTPRNVECRWGAGLRR